ncbi:hypothetical protein BDV93DRAFT_554494 [Ceratobasidium sp. AG-I]|nr:hypothetical protein BDV93DRAFT_554494 [Ceratobasidium sp. AG-I]
MSSQRTQSTRTGFRFIPPFGDKTYSGQLQEWSEHCKITLQWSYSDRREGGDVVANLATPVINGRAYTECQGTALAKKDAKNQAAGRLINSGLLSRVAGR